MDANKYSRRSEMFSLPKIGTRYHDRVVYFVDTCNKSILLRCEVGHRTKITFGNWHVYRNRPGLCRYCNYERRNKLSNAEALEILKRY